MPGFWEPGTKQQNADGKSFCFRQGLNPAKAIAKIKVLEH